MLITAYRNDNGRAVEIPEHWVDHPVLGASFSPTPPAYAPEATDTSAAEQEDPDTSGFDTQKGN